MNRGPQTRRRAWMENTRRSTTRLADVVRSRGEAIRDVTTPQISFPRHTARPLPALPASIGNGLAGCQGCA